MSGSTCGKRNLQEKDDALEQAAHENLTVLAQLAVKDCESVALAATMEIQRLNLIDEKDAVYDQLDENIGRLHLMEENNIKLCRSSQNKDEFNSSCYRLNFYGEKYEVLCFQRSCFLPLPPFPPSPLPPS